MKMSRVLTALRCAALLLSVLELKWCDLNHHHYQTLSTLFEVYGNTQTSEVKEVNYRVACLMHNVLLFEVI